jgi:mono/diheme cytochrome c family protein
MQIRRIAIRMVPVVAGLFMGSVAATVVQAEDAAAVYKKNCASCHGDSGKGDGAAGKFLKPPPGDFSVVLKDAADADITKVIKEGGKAVGKSAAMPGYGGKLSDDQISALVAHVKSLAGK